MEEAEDEDVEDVVVVESASRKSVCWRVTGHETGPVFSGFGANP